MARRKMTARQKSAAAVKSLGRRRAYGSMVGTAYGRSRAASDRIDAWVVREYEIATGIMAGSSNWRCMKADRLNAAEAGAMVEAIAA